MSFNLGDIVGDYEIIDVLGSGGMGKVYKVRNVLSDRMDAMKVLLPDLHNNPELGDRFLREIKVQASLNHPNIASLYTALRVDNQLLMVMELVDGQTLEQKVRTEPMPYEEVIEYLVQVLTALDYAHSRGVVHRDIKPANIILTSDGTVKLMDFGIARAASDRRLTKTGVALGSLFYMSPEQIKGETPDVRSDIYSLGVTFYEVLTSKRPIDGDSDYSIMTGHLQTVPLDPAELNPRVPKALAQVIMKALEKKAGDRFQTADEFLTATLEAKGTPAVFNRARITGRSSTGVTKPKIERPSATMVETIAFTTAPALTEYRANNRSPLIWLATAGAVIVLGGVTYITLGRNSGTSQVPSLVDPQRSASSSPVSGPATARPEIARPPAPPSAQAQVQASKPRPQSQAQPQMPAEPMTNMVQQPVKLGLQPGLTVPPAIAKPQSVQSNARPTQATPPPPAAPAPKDPRVIQQEEWDRVNSSKDSAVFQDFIHKHPESPFVGQAAARIEQLGWEAVKNSTDAKALRAFRTQFPNGPHAAQAASAADVVESEANGQALQDTLRRYQAAYENRDTDAIRNLWPSLGRDDVNKIDAFFKSTKAARMVLQQNGSPKFSGDSATVPCKRSVTVQMKDGTRQKPVEQNVIVHLKKSGSSWVITALE